MRFIGLLLTLALISAPATARGLQTREPAVLFDAPSAKARPLFILAGGYPVRELSRIAGWRKVSTVDGDNGWVQAKIVSPLRAAVVIADQAAIRQAPNSGAPMVFYAQSGVLLEVLGDARGWLEVLHADGETGYITAAEVWVND